MVVLCRAKVEKPVRSALTQSGKPLDERKVTRLCFVNVPANLGIIGVVLVFLQTISCFGDLHCSVADLRSELSKLRDGMDGLKSCHNIHRQLWQKSYQIVLYSYHQQRLKIQ